MGNCQRFALQGRIELRGLSGQHLLGIEGSREPPHLHARSGMGRTPGLHLGFSGDERGAGDTGLVRRLLTAEQHKGNTTIGERFQAQGGGADDAAHGGAHVALQQASARQVLLWISQPGHGNDAIEKLSVFSASR